MRTGCADGRPEDRTAEAALPYVTSAGRAPCGGGRGGAWATPPPADAWRRRAPGAAGARSGRWCCAARRRPSGRGRRGPRGRAGAGSSYARLPCGGQVSLLIERAGVDHRLRGLVAAQNDKHVADHGRLALLVELDDAVDGEPGQSRLDHADRAVHDLLAGGHDRVGLLPAEHGVRDFRSVAELRDPGLDDVHARRGDPLGHVRTEPAGDLRCAGPQARLAGAVVVVGVAAGSLPRGYLGLDADETGHVIYGEDRLGGVGDLPDGHERDLDRVAFAVVDPHDGRLVTADL